MKSARVALERSRVDDGVFALGKNLNLLDLDETLELGSGDLEWNIHQIWNRRRYGVPFRKAQNGLTVRLFKKWRCNIAPIHGVSVRLDKQVWTGIVELFEFQR